MATSHVAAALAVLSGIASSDAACCARLKKRSRGQDHREAVDLLKSVHPDGPAMAKDLKRLLNIKDAAHYAPTMISSTAAGDAVTWAERLYGLAAEAVRSAQA